IMNGDLLRVVASEALQGRQRAAVIDEGRRLGVPIGPVNTPEEFVREAQTITRGYFRRLPELGDAPVAVAPFVFSRTQVRLRRAAPRLGEDDAAFPPRDEESASGEAITRPLLAGV